MTNLSKISLTFLELFQAYRRMEGFRVQIRKVKNQTALHSGIIFSAVVCLLELSQLLSH